MAKRCRLYYFLDGKKISYKRAKSLAKGADLLPQFDRKRKLACRSKYVVHGAWLVKGKALEVGNTSSSNY